MTELKQLLTVKQAATLLAVSTSTLREFVRNGEIAYIQKGRGTERQHMSFHPEDIEDFIKRNRTRQNPPIGAKTDRVSGSTACHESGFMGQFEARLAAAKARKKK
jgi:excisionase family DNA binding protein